VCSTTSAAGVTIVDIGCGDGRISAESSADTDMLG
jgi:2-polyprenyl-3-methyl-5-hydroxy-6-metoxy-1,4-benzoquinol methylase